MDSNLNAIELEEMCSMELDTNTTISSSGSSTTQACTNTTTKPGRSALTERVRAASQSIKAGDFVSAVRLYSEALKLEPGSHVLYGNRSVAHCRLGKFDKALQDAIKARELNPNWSKAYYRQGIALQCLRRFPDALAAFGSGLAQDSNSMSLLSAFVETAMKSPLRATLEPIYRQLQAMNFDKSPFVITSVVGQELLAAGHYAAAVVVLEAALRIGSCSLKLRGSVFSALSSAYWALNDLDKAIGYMQEDLKVAKSLGDTLGECRAHANLGSAYFAKCSYKEALSAHRYQLVLAMKHQHKEQAALALTSLGHVYKAIGDLKNALSSHQRCCTLVHELGDPLAEAREIGNVGAVYLASGEFQKAIECHLDHVKLAKLLGNKAEEARAYSNLGSAYHYRRQYEQAIQFHEHVLRISQEINDRNIESKAYAGLGHAARCMRDNIQAKRWYERQLDIALGNKDKAGEAKACSNLGIVYQQLGDYDGALKLHWSHLNLCKQLDDSAGIGRAYGNIGNTYSALKQYEEAIKYHKLELQISKEVHDRGAEASTHGNLALAYQALKLFDQALTHLKLHLSIASEMKDTNSESSALCNLGNYHCVRREYEQAIHYYSEYIERTQRIEDQEAEAKANHLIGYAYLSLKKYDQALAYFERDKDISMQIQDRVSLGRAYCHLGLAKAASGELDEALEYHKSYLCISQGSESAVSLVNKLRAIGNIAHILTKQGKCEEAMSLLEKQLNLARTLGDVSSEANAFAALGACQKAAGSFEQAALFYKQELLFRQGAQDVLGEVNALDNLGECYFKSNDFTLALKCYLEQLEKIEGYRLKSMPASDECSLGNDYDADGYYGRRRKTVDSIQEYIEICLKTAKAHHNVANARFRMAHFDDAGAYHQQRQQLLSETIEFCEKKMKAKTTQAVSKEESCVDTQSDIYGSCEHALASMLAEITDKHIQCERFIGDCHFARGAHEEAIQHYNTFLGASEQGSAGVASFDQEQVYCLVGKCYQLVNNLTQALVVYEKRLVIAHTLGCKRTKAIAYGELGHIHRQLGNYEKSIEFFQKEQELAKEPALRNQTELLPAAGLSNLSCGMIFAVSGAFRAQGANSLPSPINVGLFIEAEALHGLGCVAQEMHDYERALKYHSAALAIAQQVGSMELEFRAYGAMGSAYNSIGNYDSAVSYHQKYLSVAHLVGDLNAQLGALSALGKIHSSTCKYGEAVKYLQQGLMIIEQHQASISHRDEEEARLRYELGMALWALNDLELAESHLRRSVDLIEDFNNSFTMASTKAMVAPSKSIYGTVLMSSNPYEPNGSEASGSSSSSSSSSSHYAQFQLQSLMHQSTTSGAGAGQQQRSQHLHYQGASYEALIKILIALNRSTEALLIAERSRMRLFLKPKAGFKVSSINSVDQMVEMARAQNAAILYYSMTIDGSYNSWLITPKGVLFAPLVKSSREMISQHLSSLQTDLLETKTFDFGHTGACDDLESVISDSCLASSRSLHHLNRNHLLNSSNYSLSSLFSLASSVTSASTSISSTVRHRSRSHGRGEPNSFTRSASARFGGSSSNVSTISAPEAGSSRKQRSSVGNKRNNWHGSVSLTTLYKILVRHFQDQLDEESCLTQLLLVLDGDLFLVPWSMLRNEEEEYLSERYSLLIIPSLHVLLSDQSTQTLRKTPSHSTISSLVVANPTMPSKVGCGEQQIYYENGASSREAAFVSEILSTRPLIGTEANKEAVLCQLSSAQCIHFSSYIIDNTGGDPLRMATGLGIAISPSDVVIGDSAHQLHDHEYLLTPHDLISIGLDAKLVVISCCALSSRSSLNAPGVNATTTFSSSQALKTITSALLQAGASCVLLTLWPVPLSALQVLFRVFYCSLLQGTRVSAALSEAVSTIQNTSHFSHPRYWAGFLLLGSDVRLSSHVALMSSSLATLLKTPDRCRDAMRVVLHLVEKSLQRLQRGHRNAMYTTVQSIENKIGPNTQGWRELLIAVGFRFEPASTAGLPACVFFPQSDPSDRLLRCSTALQAILALSAATIAAISKLSASSDSVAEIIDQLFKVVQQEANGGNSQQMLTSHLETLNLGLWSTPGCHELYASLGFDLMEVGSNLVTLRAGKTANLRTIVFTLQTLQALFDKDNLDTTIAPPAQHVFDEKPEMSMESSEDCHQFNYKRKPMFESHKDGVDSGIDLSTTYVSTRGEPDGQHRGGSLTSSRSNSSNSSISMPCSRSTIGRNQDDSEIIEQKLKMMSIIQQQQQQQSSEAVAFQPMGNNIAKAYITKPGSLIMSANCQFNGLVPSDRQSVSSCSSINTANTVLLRSAGRAGPTLAHHRRSQFSFDSTTTSSSTSLQQQSMPPAPPTTQPPSMVGYA